MAETWTFSQPTGYNWQGLMAPGDWSVLAVTLTNGALVIRHNPTATSESNKKPIFETDTVNGINIRVTPFALPGQGIPTVRKLQVKIEHLRQPDFLALRLLHQYDLKFILTTSNYLFPDPQLPSGLARGRKIGCVIDDMNTDWVALRFGEQVYDITLSLRILPNLS